MINRKLLVPPANRDRQGNPPDAIERNGVGDLQEMDELW